MKMILRADDIGNSKVCNIGSFEAIEYGLITSADVMLDSPGTEDALERLKAYPWVCFGWHMHMWGFPVADRKKVPSLIEKGGQFDGRFREDLATAADVSFDEAILELRAQLNRAIGIIGKAPATGGARGNSPWGRACTQIMAEYGIAYNHGATAATDPRVIDKVIKARANKEDWAQYYPIVANPERPADPKWADRKLFVLDGSLAYIDLFTDSVSSVENNYDPVRYFTEDRAGILKMPNDITVQQAFHPGYVDYWVYRLGERSRRTRAQQFVVGRTQDVHAMTSPVLRAWFKEHKIELVNSRDVLFGTREFQNHLHEIGSDLYIG